MITIQKIWERLPNHGPKPVEIKQCERLEVEIVKLQRELKASKKLHKQYLRRSMSRIKKNWSTEEIAEAIFPDSIGLADLL